MKKKKEEGIVLTKDNLLYQPFMLSKLGLSMSIVQRRTLVSFVKSLQDSIKTMRKSRYGNQQLELFNIIDNNVPYLGEDAIELSIHPKDLGYTSRDYQEVFLTIVSMANVKINLPYKDGSSIGVPLFYLIREEDWTTDVMGRVTGYNRNPTIRFAIKRKHLELFFDLKEGNPIIDYLEYTSMSISSTYSLAIYQWLSKFKYEEKPVKESLWEVRRIVGLIDTNEKGEMLENITYGYFSELKRWVLNPAQKELNKLCEKGMADFSFEFTPIYLGSKRAKNPDFIEFTILLSGVGDSIRNEKNLIISEISDERKMKLRLRTTFEQSETQITRLLRLLPKSYVGQFHKDMDELERLISENKIKIKKNLKSYANRTFTEAIKGYLDDEKRKKELLKVEEEKKQTEKLDTESEEKKNSASFDKCKELVLELKKVVDEANFNTWVKELRGAELEDNVVIITVPNRTFGELFVKKCGYDAIMKAILSVFGDVTEFKFKSIVV